MGYSVQQSVRVWRMARGCGCYRQNLLFHLRQPGRRISKIINDLKLDVSRLCVSMSSQQLVINTIDINIVSGISAIIYGYSYMLIFRSWYIADWTPDAEQFLLQL